MNLLTLIYQGKTKDVYEDEKGNYLLKLKDDATGKNGIFDPGENAIGLSIEGLGRESLKLTKYFFEKLNAMNIPTHYLDSNLDEVSMIVKPAQVFGNGLEFICRKKVGGSFLKRYGTYAEFGQELDYFIEVTLKDDERLDPPITKDALIALSLLTDDEYETCNKLTKKITKIIHDDLAEKGLELHDLKFEFGKHDGEILLIDEISGGCMRVFKDGVQIEPMELTQLILG